MTQPHDDPAQLARLRVVRDANPAELVTVSGAWSAWLAYNNGIKSRDTIENYRHAVKCASRMLPDKPTGPDVLRLLYALVRTGNAAAAKPRPLSPASANGIVRDLECIASFAAKLANDRALVNVFHFAQRLTVPPRRLAPAPADAWKRIIESGCLRHPGEEAFVGLAGVFGLRVGTIMRVLPTDYDAQRVILEVRSKGNSIVPVDVWTDARVRAGIEWALTNRAAMRSAGKGGARECDRYVFPWSHTYVTALAGRIRAAFGVDAARYFPAGRMWHQFRRTGATESALQARREGGSGLAAAAAFTGDTPGKASGYYARDPVKAAPLPQPAKVERKPRQVRLPIEAPRTTKVAAWCAVDGKPAPMPADEQEPDFAAMDAASLLAWCERGDDR